MKRLLTALGMLSCLGTMAQVNQGTIIYTETINLKMDEKPEGIDDASWETIKKRIEEPRQTQRQLLFTDKASLYRYYEDPNKQVDYDEGSGGMFQMRFDRPEEVTSLFSRST